MSGRLLLTMAGLCLCPHADCHPANGARAETQLPTNWAAVEGTYSRGWNVNSSVLSTWVRDFWDSALLFSCSLDFKRPLLNGLVSGFLQIFPGGTTPDPGTWWVRIWTDPERGLRSLQERCYVGEGCNKVCNLQPSSCPCLQSPWRSWQPEWAPWMSLLEKPAWSWPLSQMLLNKAGNGSMSWTVHNSKSDFERAPKSWLQWGVMFFWLSTCVHLHRRSSLLGIFRLYLQSYCRQLWERSQPQHRPWFSCLPPTGYLMDNAPFACKRFLLLQALAPEASSISYRRASGKSCSPGSPRAKLADPCEKVDELPTHWQPTWCDLNNCIQKSVNVHTI